MSSPDHVQRSRKTKEADYARGLMENKINYAFVGIFVIALLTALIVVGVWLSSQWRGKTYHIYAAYMTESVSGLAPESPVKYSGVKVGYVDCLGLDPKNPLRVKLLLKIEDTAPITETTTARLTQQGLTGVSSVELNAGAANSPPLQARPGERYPVIKTMPSLFARLDTASNEMVVRLNNSLHIFEQTFDPPTQQALHHTIQNIDKITSSLAAQTSNLNRTIQQADSLLKKGISTGDQLTLSLQSFSSQTLPQVNQLLMNATALTNQLNMLSGEAAQNPSVLIKGRTPPKPGPGE